MNRMVIDANCLCYRAQHTIGDLSVEEFKTGVIFGFLYQLQKLAKAFSTHKFVFCWDSGQSYRKELYRDYKEKRAKMREEESDEDKTKRRLAYDQFTKLEKTILPNLGFECYSQSGLEGDDMMAIIVMSSASKDDWVIVTTDQDMYQMLDFCTIYNPATKKTLTREWFISEYGVEPADWSEVKALAGCTSDEVAGIAGVGEKTAISYIRGELKQKAVTYKEINSPRGKRIIERNRQLVYLPHVRTEPIEPTFYKFDFDYFVDVCTKYDFRSMLKKTILDDWRELFNVKRRTL